ncbi:monocarboxylate transporter 8-like isoform X1 [Oncorhynchus masou masou]|uniref:monocarboxylate transporter 8-like isoform X1 n=1 Tax=Oncorhynchus masou masou TaxID=90313 RepID=UPI003183FB7F
MESQTTQSEKPDPGLAQSLGTYLSYYEHEEMKRDGSRPDSETEENKDSSSQIVSCAHADSAPDLDWFPEGRFVWLVVLAATWCNGSIFGIQKSFGIIHMMLVKAHEDSNNEVSQFAIAWVGALAMGMVFLCSPLVSIVTDHVGCRVTAICGALVAFLGLLTSSFTMSLGLWYFTYGVLFGCGSSFVFLPSLVTLGHYFPQRLGLVNGVVMAGSSVFSISLPALLEEVGTPLGLSTTFQILSALMLIQAALAFSFCSRLYHRNLPTNTAQLSSTNLSSGWQQGLTQTRRYCNLGVFHLPNYRVWAFGVATAMLGNSVPYIYLMSFVEEQFVETPVKEWVLLVCIGVTSCVGHLLFGRVGDLLHGARKIYLQAGSFMVLGLASMLVPLCVRFEGLVAVCLLLGLCDGCVITLMAPVTFDLVGPQRASQAIGYLMGLMALPMTAGPPLAGLLHDHFGDYHMAFYLAGVPPMVGGVLLFFVPNVHQCLLEGQQETLPRPSPDLQLSPPGSDHQAPPIPGHQLPPTNPGLQLSPPGSDHQSPPIPGHQLPPTSPDLQLSPPGSDHQSPPIPGHQLPPTSPDLQLSPPGSDHQSPPIPGHQLPPTSPDLQLSPPGSDHQSPPIPGHQLPPTSPDLQLSPIWL